MQPIDYETAFDGAGDPAMPPPRRVVNGRDTKADLLRQLLDINSWSALDIPPEPRLLGDLITPTSRVFLVGRTGLGKTLLAHAMAAGMATGQGFLHWRSDRPSRWLVLDGEMPTALIKSRSDDLRRQVGPIPSGFLAIYSLDRAEEFAKKVPGLGILAPINTKNGQRFVLRLASALAVEGIIFDNVMSLIGGDQKDEVPWTETLPLVTALSKQRIAQVYLDHTGHNADRQYGSATKAWRMDAVGIMKAPEQSRPDEVAFSLSFEPPGKARRRTPQNWKDFQATTIRLTAGRWTSEAGDTDGAQLSPTEKLWHDALHDALCRSSTPGRTTRNEWFAEAARTGLAEPIIDADDHRVRSRKMGPLRKAIFAFRQKRLIGVDGELITAIGQTA